MSILLDEAQQAIARETARVLGARHDTARLLALLDETGACDEHFWTTAVQQGWTGLGVPSEFGGMGLGVLEQGLVAQEVGRFVAGAPFLAAGHAAARALLRGGDEAVHEVWLPGIASGEVRAALALAEGSEPLPGEAEVTFSDGRLTGAKSGVTGALGARVAVVWALDEAGVPVLVLADLTDVAITPLASFDNARLFGNLAFDQSPATLLASGDDARGLALEVLSHAALLTAFEQVGGAEAVLYATRDYALQRRAFGQPIGAFQSVKHRLAELYGLVEIARANCLHAAASEGQAGFVEAGACARLTATEAYDTAARDGVQIHGGIGVTWEGGLHLHMRRARSLAIEAGHGAFWEDVLASILTGVAA